ncbi:choice-of-anchor D domain-containing protein [Solirubrobacter ginsenosidimutans]|uniref:Choice-of-anchor D domain-containing protein n=1 Tax=Solirubrobacter ginsenosidimutans TaxID=490573 RepID=A0A9X3N0G5_9ACTN|nr:choice-of-anchor D domain-containing protein [Solirubrobacter ginsenosidimutans]MDA0166189.1 choice-of-anchor D domain-containing protein [Solirubrobacter ginsenosidimutans]
MRSHPFRFAFATAAALLALPAAAAQADPPPGQVVKTYTTQGCGSTFVAPTGVSLVTVKATGANGGGGVGGKGAVVQGSFAVTPGGSYTVCVNAGGGSGGLAMNQFGNDLDDGSDGGGYSSVSAAGAQYVLAGGGGGTGGDGLLGSTGAAGGNASYPPSTAATSGLDWDGLSGYSIGHPATDVAAGLGAAGYSLGNNSQGGSSLAGGDGGNGGQLSVADGSGGGGGGAGYFGGGGGTGGHGYSSAFLGGGGGGGSSYCDVSITCTGQLNTSHVPSVVITYAKLATVTVAEAPVTAVAPSSNVTFNGVVTPAAVGSGEGTVSFKLDGVAIPGCQNQAFSAATAPAATATCATTAPATTGTHTLQAVYSGNDERLGSENSVTFTVGGPGLGLSAAGLDFGSVTTGQTSAEQSVTLKNTGAGALALANLALTGADASAFTLAGTDCGATLAADATCVVRFAFAPARTGAHTASLAVESSAPGSPHSVTLTGTGTAAAAPPTPTATPTPTPTPPADGAALSPKAGGKATVSRVDNTVSLPLTCPAGDVCKVDGSLKLRAGDIESRRLRAVAAAAAAKTQVLARFDDISVKGGQVRTLKLTLPKSFVRAAQKAGKRRMTATLTINTTFGSGQTTTRTQRIVLLIPLAPKQAPHPKFTG